MTVDFEQAFSDFIDRTEYDQAANALFSIVRIAFLAGWLAGGGNPPKSQNIITLVRAKRDIEQENEPYQIITDLSPDSIPKNRG